MKIEQMQENKERARRHFSRSSQWRCAGDIFAQTLQIRGVRFRCRPKGERAIVDIEALIESKSAIQGETANEGCR